MDSLIQQQADVVYSLERQLNLGITIFYRFCSSISKTERISCYTKDGRIIFTSKINLNILRIIRKI